MKSIIMKSILALVSILLSESALLADRLYIDPFDISGGETKDVSICLENSQAISAFQTDIYLSTGLEIVKQGEDWMVLASRASSDHTLVVNTEGREIVRLVCFSNTNTSFSGNEGAVVNLRIKADDGFEGGWISLTNIKLSDSSNHDIILESSDAYVTGIVAPQTITISEGSVDLKVGQEYGLTANVYPDNTTDRTIIWTSDNESVVTVDSNGYLRAMSQGSATITATCGNVSATCAVTVSAREVESVILSNTEVELKVGGIFNLTADVYPEDAIDKTVTWSSDNDAVATVDAGGSVTAISPGTAAITAICGNVTAACVVTVIATPVESVTLSETTAELKVGGSLVLTATVLPEEATDKTVKWSSDNEAVATVDANGNVTAVSLGTATISANSGNYSASCVVTVIATPVEIVTLSQSEAQLKVGGSLVLTATVLPEEATDKTVKWSSDNELVAMVDANGNVTAVSLGTATITASCGSVSASCVVTVDPVLVESIILSTANWSGEEGEVFHIDATVLPENATDKSLVWTSSDETIATVDSEGNVSVLKEGTCVIAATAADGSSVSAECIITSTAGVDGIFSEAENQDIYDINGLLIKKVCGYESLKDLTPGIYIIRQGGAMKKFVIR